MRQLFLGALLALASCAGERWSVVERDAKIVWLKSEDLGF